jgi:nitroreductase
MIKGSTQRPATHGVHTVFLDRWSPRAMSGEALSEAQLLTLFEAARWAPSSMNFQPWRFLYARRDSDFWPAYLDLLAAGNRLWAERAGALVLFISRTHFDGDGRACITHSYDTGAAWENFALQGTLDGLVVHGMQGFDYERARRVLRVPAEYAIEAMAAVGLPGAVTVLPEQLRPREQPSGRRELGATICEGPFSL